MARFSFAAASNTSSEVDFGPGYPLANATRFLGLRIVSGTWTSATLGLKGSNDGTTFYPLKTGGNFVGISAIDATNIQYVEIPAYRWVKLWSHNGSGVDTTQTNAMVIEFVD